MKKKKKGNKFLIMLGAVLFALFVFVLGYSIFEYTSNAIIGNAIIIVSKTNPQNYTGKGYLNMSTIPKRANLFVDELYVGKTPRLKPLDAGMHTYRVELTGYEKREGEFIIVKGRTKRISMVLQEKE